MASPLQQINTGRRPVVVYSGRGAAPTRPRTGPQRDSRPTPPRVGRGLPSGQRGQQQEASPWAGFVERVTSTKAAQETVQQQAQQQAEEERGGFWGSDFGKGLGFAINNPVTRAAFVPINYIQTGGRAITLGAEEAAEAMHGAPDWLKGAVGQIPGLGQLMKTIDTERTEADPRSNWEKVFSPTTTYGGGELLPDTSEAGAKEQWMARLGGFGLDVAFDPLTYVGGGATRLINAASHVDEAAEVLGRANQALRVAEEAGDAAEVAKATQRVAMAEDYVKRAPSLPPRQFEMPLPPNRTGRANLLGELSLTPEGNKLVNEFGPELARGGQRGFQTMPTPVKEALGISEPGLRFRGFNTPIPGTGKVAEVLTQGGGAVRAGLSRMPGMNSKLANVRVPKGLEDAYATLTRGRGGDFETAALDVGVRNEIQAGSGAFTARANRVLVDAVRKTFKGNNEAENRALMAAAEASAEPNEVNALFARILDVYQRATGRILDERFLKDPNTYVPHKLDPKFRRVLADLSKNGDQAAEDFLREGGFYKDDLLEGSGFLERSRKLEPNPDGTPRTLNIGGREVTIESGTIDALNNNRSLREAFPNYTGNFYDDDPARIAEAYIGSLSRQAGRDRAVKKLLGSGTAKVNTMTGALDETRQAMNEALRLQNEGALLDTAKTPYVKGQPVPEVPTRPVVPGSAVDRQRRAAVEAAETAADQAALAASEGTGIPEQAVALAGEAAALPRPAARYGDINPEDFFVTTKGKEATAARRAEALGPGRTYAKAAAKDAAATEQAIRESLGDLKTTMASGLRGTIKEQTAQIRAWNKQFKTYSDQLKALGPLTSENIDELSVLNNKLEAEIEALDLSIKRKSSSWKGRTTKAQKKVEAELRAALDRLKSMRDQAQANAVGVPQAMRDEWELRTTKLNQPVKDATERLLRAEMGVPVPHNQAAVEQARQAIESVLGAGRGDPEKYLAGYRAVVDEARQGARAAVETVDPSDTMAHERQVYGSLLEQIRDIGSRRKNGRLTRADQQLMDEAVALRNQLSLTLGRGETAGGSVATAYDDAMQQLALLRDDIKAGRIPAADLPAARAERDRLARQFGSGGRFAEQQRARAVLNDMSLYDQEVARRTEAERKALDMATYARQRQQEAIVWGNQAKTVRHFGEDEGFGVGQQRIIEPVTEPPQPEAFAETARGGRVQVPRTEQEALASLSSRAEYGGTVEQAARTDARNLERRVAAGEQELPGRITAGREQVAAEFGAAADAELGPMAKQSETYKKLAEDMAVKTNLVAKRGELKEVQARLVKTRPSSRKVELTDTIDEIEAVAKSNPLLDDDKLTQTESLLNTHREDLDRIDDTKFRAKELQKAADDAANGKLGDVMIAALNENWRALHNGPVNTGDIIMDAELHKRFTNLFELSKEPKLLGRTFNAFTNMFKTYATLSPGFHVRNTIGGLFMNTSDGVTLAHQLEGATLWQRYMKRGDDWLETQPRRIKEAFEATFASGAGGRYEEAGTAARSSNRVLDKAMSNMFTRGGQRWGSRVEGGLRLGMALDSITNGQTVDQAFSRISRVHFNYAAVSQLDETMKRIIPFWTFMSRNLPLQIQQMWTNPRAYSYYNNLVNNFSLPDDEFTPEYWTRQGAWRTPLSIAGNPLYAQPDLGFTRVESDIKMLGDALGGDVSQLFSQANPAIGATIDFAQKRDSFYDRNYDDTDYKKMSGPVGAPIALLARMLGQTNEAGQVSENFTNYISSLVPPINQAMRLAPASTGATRGGVDTLSKWMRYAGAPTQILTPAVQDSEYWRQWFEMQDEAKRQQAMVREAAS